jgi:hypothetical protein
VPVNSGNTIHWSLPGCLSPVQAAVAAGDPSRSSPFKALKSIQLCSTLTVRGAFSSDGRFGLQVLLCRASTARAVGWMAAAAQLSTFLMCQPSAAAAAAAAVGELMGYALHWMLVGYA